MWPDSADLCAMRTLAFILSLLSFAVLHAQVWNWAVSAGDLQITYDWEASRWRNIPVGFQLGKVTKIAGLPCRLAVNPQYNLKNDPGLPEWQLTFTFTALFPSF